MEVFFFVLSGVAVISYFIKVISCIAGNSMNVPAPIFHVADIGFENTYFSTPALAYQIYFWANYAGIFGG